MFLCGLALCYSTEIMKKAGKWASREISRRYAE